MVFEKGIGGIIEEDINVIKQENCVFKSFSGQNVVIVLQLKIEYRIFNFMRKDNIVSMKYDNIFFVMFCLVKIKVVIKIRQIIYFN